MNHITEESGGAINMEHVAESALDNIQPGMIIRGEVVTIDFEFVYVNVGTKSDGRIPLEEFEEKPDVGDEIDVMLQDKKLVDGVYQFSKFAAEEEKRWQNFLTWYRGGNNNLSGRIKSEVNKGKLIECSNTIAFLPFSLAADLKGESASDQEYEFSIKSIDEKKRSVILSRKDFLDEEKQVRWDHFISKYVVGDRIMGEVVKFVEFGAFVRIEGVDALLHRNDISWKNVFKQRKILKLGEQREYVILGIKKDEGKISLGLKQLVEDPWLRIDERHSIGDIVTGKVVTLTNLGAFVEIEDDIEGFINISDLSWSKNNMNVKDFLEKGSTIKLMILDINKDERKLLLGLKQTLPNPWDTIKERFPIDSIHKKKIKKIVKFGIFVELENGIDGLIHISDVSWDDSNKDLTESYKVSAEVEFKILEIKSNEMKIACGIKQLIKSPWEIIKEKYLPRKKVDGVISGITQFGLFVKLEESVEGLVHISEVSKNRIENLEDHFKIGDKVGTIILGVDVNKKRLSLSIKHYDIISEKEELEKILNNTSSSRVTLGDMIKIKLDD